MARGEYVIMWISVAHALYISGRCVHEWLPDASCRRCVDACPSKAIELRGRRPEVDPGKCTLCGACMRVCPTEALVASPPYSQLVEKVPIVNGVAVLRCGENINCAAHIDDSLVLALRARGAKHVVAEICETCPRGVDALVEAKRLAELGVEVVRRRDAPSGSLEPPRGGMLSVIGLYVKSPRIIKREGVTLIRGIPEKRDLLLKSIHVADDSYISSRFVGKEIDYDACDYLGTCAALCPTGALRAERGVVDFSPSMCVACKVCVEACKLGAIRNRDVDVDAVRRGTRTILARFRLRRCRECGALFASKHGEDLCPSCRHINDELKDIFGEDARLEKGF